MINPLIPKNSLGELLAKQGFTPTTPLQKVVMQQAKPTPDILKVASDTLSKVKDFVMSIPNMQIPKALEPSPELQQFAQKAGENAKNQHPLTKKILTTIAPGIQAFIDGGFKGYSDFFNSPDATAKREEMLKPENLALSFTGVGLSIEKISKPVIAQIAKEVNPKAIVNLLGKLGIDDKLIPSLAEGLSKITNENDVVNFIKNSTGNIKNLVKQRGFSETVIKSPKTAPEVAQKVESYYLPKSNQALVDEANKTIKTSIDEAIKIAKAPEWSAKSNVYAQQLIHEFQSAGRFQDAIEMVEQLSKKATTQGQAIQALSLYNKLTPQGVLKYAQKVIDQANAGGVGKIKLDENFAKEIIDVATNLQTMPEGRQKIVETAKLLQKISDKIPASWGQKISSIQTFAQLLNPKTAIRNVVGNTGFQVLENIKDVPATALDSALSLITGQRTKSFPNIPAQLKGLKTGFVEGVEDALNRIDTSNIPTKFDLPNTATFKGTVGSFFEKLLNIELKATDRAFYKSAYDGSLAEQMVAKKINQATDTMKETAHLDALYRTFQDDNVVSKLFTGIKKALNVGKDFGVGDFVLKYPKTPGNLLARGIEYSPGGFVNSLIEAVKPLAGKEFNQRAFVESFSRAMTGSTALVGTGALLHKLGIITGKPEKDKDISSIQKLSGLGQYRINVDALKRFVFSGFNPDVAKLQDGDNLISYDWFQPSAIGISIGANIEEGGGIRGGVASVIDSLAQGVNTLAEQPLVSGLTRVMKTQDFASSIEEVFKGVPSSFVPTLLSQINQLIDNTQRNAYDPSIYEYALNLAKQKIPGLAQTLPPAIDAFGNDLERYQGSSNNVFNVLFNPAFISQYKKTPEAQMVLDLMSITGDTKQAPRIVNKSYTVNGQSMKLTPKQITAMQRYVGTTTKELFSSFASDPRFQSLAPTDKVKYLANVLSDVGEAGKIVILGDRPKKPSADALRIIQMFNGRQ